MKKKSRKDYNPLDYRNGLNIQLYWFAPKWVEEVLDEVRRSETNAPRTNKRPSLDTK